MDFRIDATLPSTPAALWAIFFDVQRVASLIPGCENVVELKPLEEYSAVMRQKIGPFKLEVPTRIVIESHQVERQVVLSAVGSDRFTGTSLDVRMKVDLEDQGVPGGPACKLAVEASMQVAGRLASLGYPIVKKRSEDLFSEFERRLRAELAGIGGAAGTVPAASGAGAGTDLASAPTAAKGAASSPASEAARGFAVEHASGAAAAPGARLAAAPAYEPAAAPAHTHAHGALMHAPRPTRGTELVLLWPRVGISLAVAIAVAHGAVAFGQSPWWWLAAPLLGVAAGLGRRED
jgi:carbon monoxide dehydrogenase subunit G